MPGEAYLPLLFCTCLTAQGAPSKQAPAAKPLSAADISELEQIMQNMAIRSDFILPGEQQ